MKKLFFIVTIVFISLNSFAQSGSLDNTFGTGGKVITPLRSGSNVCTSMLIQADGKLLLAGSGLFASNKNVFALVRLNTNGTLDNTFGTGGIVITDIGSGGSAVGNSVAIQSDGKIVVAGSGSNGPNSFFVLIRYTNSGQMDNTFGVGGKVSMGIGSNTSNRGLSVTIQNDGKILIAGSSNNATTWVDFALIRFNNNGTLDGSFGNGGIVTTDVGSVSTDEGYAVALQDKDKIIVAGNSKNISSSTDFALVRYNNDGSLDNTFGSGGKVTTDFGSNSGDIGKSIVIQSDGKIVLAGLTYNGSSMDFALLRYNNNGTLDNTFGAAGKVRSDIGNITYDEARSVALQSDGKIVIAGYTSNGSSNADFVLVRYNSDGTLDNSFGNSGKVTLDFGSNTQNYCNSVAIQSDGKIVVAGYSIITGTLFAIARFNNTGALDNTFGTNGKVITDIIKRDDLGSSVAIQNDGKIIIAGTGMNYGMDRDFALTRFNTDGTLDMSWGAIGMVFTSFGTDYDRASSVAIQRDGKILAAGSAYNGNVYKIALVRYTAAWGFLDNTFGTGGKVTTAIGTGTDIGTAIAIQPDGKIVVTGQTYNGTDIDFAIVRYDTLGNLDNTFGTGGKVTTAIVGAGDDKANAIAIQSDGKIVLAGESDKGANYDFALVRYNTDGTLDNSFGTGGKVLTAIGNADDKGKSVVIQKNDGKIIVAGSTDNGTNDNFALVRYNTDGSLDNSFGTGGKVTTAIGSSGDAGYSAALMSDGKIVVGGESNNGTNYDFALARYNTNGTLDNSFGNGGKVTTAVGSGSDEGFSIAIQNDGKIVLAGTSYGDFDNDFSVARYNNYNTGIAETLSGQFSISPNPTNGIFYVHQDATTNEIQTIEIYNVLGEKIYSKASNHQVTDALDISGSPDGIYFVKIVEGEISYTTKIVKQ